MYTYSAGSPGTFSGPSLGYYSAALLAAAQAQQQKAGVNPHIAVANTHIVVVQQALGIAQADPAKSLLLSALSQLQQSLSQTSGGAASLIAAAEATYKKAQAAAASAGTPIPPWGGGQPAPTTSQEWAAGTTSVLQNISSSLARIFVGGGTPVGPPQTPQPTGGTPYAATGGPPGYRAPVQTSAGVLSQRIGPFTVGQWAIGGGVGLLAVALMRNVVKLAVVGGAVAGGAWLLNQAQTMPGRRVGQRRA